MQIGIVTFMRPRKCADLIASIRRHCARPPHIMVADNGIRLPDSTANLLGMMNYDHAETFVMPFDCGLAECRNFLMGKANEAGHDLLLLDDDFLFTDETQILRLYEVLAHDPRVGVACGSASVVQPKILERRRTAGGLPYHIVPLADNFQLIRREVIQQGIRWNPALKVGEHRNWFDQVAAGGWKVAHVPSCRVKHDRTGSEGTYKAFRDRASDFKMTWEKATMIRPIVVLGVGHSGTSIVTKMIARCGWNAGDVKLNVCENIAVQQLNKAILARQGICPCGATGTLDERSLRCSRCNAYVEIDEIGVTQDMMSERLETLLPPWVIKDPRLVLTLDDWMPVLSKYKPTLVLVEREAAAMAHTYLRHGFPDMTIYGRTVLELQQLALWHFKNWAWQKVRIRFEDLTEAVKMFDIARAEKHAGGH